MSKRNQSKAYKLMNINILISEDRAEIEVVENIAKSLGIQIGVAPGDIKGYVQTQSVTYIPYDEDILEYTTIDYRTGQIQHGMEVL